VRLWLLVPCRGRGTELRRVGLAAGALLAAGLCGCLGADDERADVSVGAPLDAPALEHPELVAWRNDQLVSDRRTRALVGDPEGLELVAMQWERPSWSPDGARLAFTGKFGAMDADEDIWLVRADGSGRRRLTSDGASFHPVWSPDGKWIYFARRPEDHPAEITLSDGRTEAPVWIWAMRPDGSNRRPITSPVAGRFEIPGAFSPDGETLAFTRGTHRELDEEGRAHNTSEVWVMRPDGSRQRRLARRARDPAFSSDGRRIAFASDRDETGSLNYGDRIFFANELYAMDADGSRPRRLTRTRVLNELQPAWMPDGSRIAYQRGYDYQNAEITTVIQANADGSCPRPVFPDAGLDVWYAAPAWRPGDARARDRALRC
jgi:Tol biopolymer transport system component